MGAISSLFLVPVSRVQWHLSELSERNKACIPPVASYHIRMQSDRITLGVSLNDPLIRQTCKPIFKSGNSRYRLRQVRFSRSLVTKCRLHA